MDPIDLLYQIQWNSARPGCCIFLCNQDIWSCEVINRIINHIIKSNFNGDKPKNRCFISVLGYGNGAKELCSGYLIDLYQNPIGVENRTQKVSDGNGGLFDVPVNLPIWVEPIEEVRWINIRDGFKMAKQLVENWIVDLPNNPRPIIFDVGCHLHELGMIEKDTDSLLFGIHEGIYTDGIVYDDIPQEWVDLYNTEDTPKCGVFTLKSMSWLCTLLFANFHYMPI